MHSDSSRGFWAIIQEADFSQTYRFCRKLDNHWYFHIQVKQVYMNRSEFCQNPKILIFGPFLELFRPSWSNGIFFFQKLGFVIFLTLWLSNFMQRIRKNWSANPEILNCERTDGWTNKAKLIGHFRQHWCLKINNIAIK